MISKDNWLAEKLLEHRGHDIGIMVYGSDDKVYDVCIECFDCNEVLVSAEDYELELIHMGLKEE
jgi:hypothetical protein